MPRKIANGGRIGGRNLPNNKAASGIWDIEDAYFAARDGQWPAWPQDVGIPYREDLLVWLESDFGLYKADGAPASVGDQVETWFNRGRIGSVQRDPAGGTWTLGVSGAGIPIPEVAMQATSLSQVVPALVKTNNYLFSVSRATSTVANVLMPHDPNTGVQTATLQPRIAAVSGSSFNAPASNAGNTSVTSGGGLAASWMEAYRVDFAYAAQIPPSVVGGGGVLTRFCAGGRFDAANAPVVEAFNDNAVPNGVAFTQFLRVLGSRSSGSSIGSAGSRVHALLWYSLDEPLSYTDVNAIAAYLGGKYGYR